MPLRGLFGILVILFLAWLLSEDRRRVAWRTLAVGLGLQLLLALALLKLPPFKGAFLLLNRLAQALEQATLAGTSVVFGFLGGGPLPYAETTRSHRGSVLDCSP